MAENLTSELRATALVYGFTACAITHPGAIPQAPERLGAFVKAGYHGQMGLDGRAHGLARQTPPRSGQRRAASSCWPKPIRPTTTLWTC